MVSTARSELRAVTHTGGADAPTPVGRGVLLDAIEAALVDEPRPWRAALLILIDLEPTWLLHDSLDRGRGDELIDIVRERLVGLFGSERVVALSEGRSAVLCGEISGPDEASTILGRISEILGRRPTGRPDLPVPRLTIGSTLIQHGARRADEVLRDAEVALHQARLASHRVAILDEPMRRRVLSENRSHVEILTAFDEEQFELYFQPIVDLRSGVPTGIEALIRWNHPRDGLVGPQRILRPVEMAGLESRLGQWVLGNACERLTQIGEVAPSGSVMHVNIAPSHLIEAGFVESTLQTISDAGAQPSDICIEITEDAMLHEEAVGVLIALRNAGIEVALDDFGSGYSSLGQLATLPVPTVKLDRSFTAAIGTPDGRAVVEVVASIGTALDRTVIAEGIESVEQLETLRTCGYRIGQGYHFARPLPMGELLDWLGNPR